MTKTPMILMDVKKTVHVEKSTPVDEDDWLWYKDEMFGWHMQDNQTQHKVVSKWDNIEYRINDENERKAYGVKN